MSTADTPPRSKMLLLATGLAGAAPFLLQSLLSIALNSIGQDLHSTTVELAWTVNAFSLGMALIFILAGRMGDIFGRRRIYVVGSSVFLAALVLCTVAQDVAWLIAASAVAGVGTALMASAALSIINTSFSGRAKAMAIGIFAAATGIGQGLGPIIGGGLCEALGWRSIFWILIPLTALSLVLGLLTIKEAKDETGKPVINRTSAALLSLGLVSIIFALMQTGDWGWGSPVVIGLLVAGPVLLVAFRVNDDRSDTPLIDSSILHNRTFIGAGVTMIAFNLTEIALLVFGALYLQTVLGYPPFVAGALFLPATGLLIVIPILTGRAAHLLNPRWLIVGGIFLIGVSMLLLGFVAQPDSSYWAILPSFVIFGLGGGMVAEPLMTVGLSGIPKERSGVASGSLMMAAMLGGSLGVSIASAVFSAFESSELKARAASLPRVGGGTKELEGLLAGSKAAQDKLSHLGGTAVAKYEAIARDVFTFAFERGMWAAAATAFLAAALAFILVRVPKGHPITEARTRD